MAPRNVLTVGLVCTGLLAAAGAHAADDGRAGPARADVLRSPASPAVQAAEQSRLPGDLRPARPIVPQVAVPLRREAVRGRPESRAASTRAAVTDECAARVSSEERRICALLTQSASRPRVSG